MFKKTIIASSVLAAMASTVVVAEEAKEDKYGHDFYGVIAVQVAQRSYENTPKNDGVQVNNETRLGWRGYANFDGLPKGTKFVWQVEGGYVDPSFSNQNGGFLGNRDTFIGFDNDQYGLVRVGRVLSPLYELVDWPASNPGLGDVWDWGGSIDGRDFNDRQSDTVRWDSKELWSGFTLDVAFGAGGDRDGDTDSEEASSNFYHGIAAHQQFKYEGGWVQFDLAYEMNYDTQKKITEKDAFDHDLVDSTEYWDNTTYLVGLQGGHGSVGYFAQYRIAEAKNNSKEDAAGVAETTQADQEEKGYSVGATYNFGVDNKWQAKVAHAKVEGVEVSNSADKDTGREVWSTQLLYSIDTNAVVYARYRDVERSKTSAAESFTEASVGVEYWF